MSVPLYHNLVAHTDVKETYSLEDLLYSISNMVDVMALLGEARENLMFSKVKKYIHEIYSTFQKQQKNSE